MNKPGNFCSIRRDWFRQGVSVTFCALLPIGGILISRHRMRQHQAEITVEAKADLATFWKQYDQVVRERMRTGIPFQRGLPAQDALGRVIPRSGRGRPQLVLFVERSVKLAQLDLWNRIRTRLPGLDSIIITTLPKAEAIAQLGHVSGNRLVVADPAQDLHLRFYATRRAFLLNSRGSVVLDEALARQPSSEMLGQLERSIDWRQLP